VRDRSGEIVGASFIAHDITERKEAEQKLAWQAEELMRSRRELETHALMLRSILDSMDEGLVAASEEGKFILWNPAATKILGRGPVDLPGEEWPAYYGFYLPDLVTPLPFRQDPLWRALHGEANRTQMFVRNPQVPTGAWLDASANPLKDKSGASRGGVVAFRDVTAAKTAEQEIRSLNADLEKRVIERTAELEAANKEMEAFTYSVSHDLRAPLRHINGFTRILVEDFGPVLPDEARQHLQRIESGANRMGQLVDELLALTRVGRQALSMQPCDIGEVVKEVLTILEPETKDRQIEWKIGELPSIQCDTPLMRQVFQNLIGNALKYTRPRSPAVIEIGQIEENGQSAIFVRDNGVGFNMKYADKLFGVFQRLHRPEEFEGTGVGLATVQRIVEKHGGRVWAEAELDHGATFYFTLGSFKTGTAAGSQAALGAGM
jgi:PAS domain S-box-containing protein